MSRLDELGRQVAALQDADLEALRAMDRAGEGFIRAVRQQSHRLPRRRSSTVLLVAAVVGVLAIVTLGLVRASTWTAPRPLAVTPDVPLGDVIRAPNDRAIPLRFSDGSEVELSAGTEAVVRELTARGAEVDLTRGTAQIAVKHRPDTSWSLRAGPYAVRVTGTRFDLTWSPQDRRFALELWEGSVRVSGAESEHSAVEMIAPERLVIDPGGWHLGREQPPPEATPEPSTEPAPQASAAVASPSPDPPASPAKPAAPAVSWERAARRGDYQTAYEAAQAQGLGRLAQSGSPSQLVALAETCRLSGHGSEGVAVLSRLRARFPGTDEAALAAFQLGRLTGGARWFQTYLDERPSGSLAREALGRLMEALDHGGAHAEAQAAARRYLVTYPSGPHAAIAARILGE